MKSYLPKTLKTFCISLIVLGNTNIFAKEARTYSTEGYCILAYEQVDNDYLKKYESRLGFRPKIKLCNRINRLISEFQPKSWNYQYGQPYPGSSIYLEPSQVDKIMAARKKHRKKRR